MTAHDTRLEYPKDAHGTFTAGVAGHCATCGWWSDLHDVGDERGAVRDIAGHLKAAAPTPKG